MDTSGNFSLDLISQPIGKPRPPPSPPPNDKLSPPHHSPENTNNAPLQGPQDVPPETTINQLIDCLIDYPSPFFPFFLSQVWTLRYVSDLIDSNLMRLHKVSMVFDRDLRRGWDP